LRKDGLRSTIRFVRRGRVVEVGDIRPTTTLLDWLRLVERATGTKEGCAEGDCGACTIVLARLRDGRLVHEPVCACITLLGQVDGTEIITVEDLAKGGALHPVQDALVRRHGSQCGFCTPGIVMSLFALYQDGARPAGREAVNEALAGNLCRCTGYRPIVEAGIESCGGGGPADGFAATAKERAAALLALEDGRDMFLGDEAGFLASPVDESSLASLLREHEDAVLVSGATDVGLWVTKELRPIPKLILLGRVRGLDTIEDDESTFTLGATVTHARARAPLTALDPDLGELVRRFGSAQVRASGTVGGNIANGSPIGDLAPAFIALGAMLELRRGDEIRRLPLDEFFIAYRRQDLRPGEFVRRIEIDKLGPGDHFRCHKVAKRFDEDISAVMAAHRLRIEGGRVTAARIAYGGMAATPKRAPRAEEALVGARLTERGEWQGALDALSQDYAPLSDLRASAGYRMAVARNLLVRTLAELAVGTTAVTRLVGRRSGDEVLHAAE